MRKSISKTFIIMVLLTILACQGGLFVWAYFHERDSLAEGLEQKIKVVSRLMVNASAKGLSEFDLAYLELLMDEILQDNDFTSMSLKTNNGFEVMERHKQATGRVTKRVVLVKLGAKELGQLELTFSLAQVDLLLKERLIIEAGILTGTLFLIALVIFTYFRTRIAKRISSIEVAIQQMTDGDLTVKLEDHSRDELGAIAAGIDILGQRLSHSITRIRSFSQDVVTTAQDLDATFSDTKTALSHQHDATEEISRSINAATSNQTHISTNASKLLDFSRENSATVVENLAVYEEIAERIDILNDGINKIHDTVLTIDTSAKGVAGLARQAAYAVENAVDSTAAIKESFGDIEQMVAESSRLSDQTTQVITEKGIVAVSETQLSMARIFELSESLSKTIAKLAEESKDIAKILSVINEITDKIKLLSLNASIISAQAGKHGLGFAVVAEEMKLLSEGTAESTKEISVILGGIHHDIIDAVRETGETNTIVKEGSRLVIQAGIALKEILSASHDSQKKVAYIRLATDLQQENLMQVVTALKKLRDLNISVSQSSTTEETNISAVSKNIGELREAMEHVGTATAQQVSSMNEMMCNIEAATRRTSEIYDAVHEAQQVNGAICASLCDVVDIGSQTVDSITAAAKRLTTMRDRVGILHKEMERFRV